MTSNDRSDESVSTKTYLVMKANAEEALELAAGWWESKEVPKYVHVRKIERDDIAEFVDLYNRCFLTSPDPFRLLTIEFVAEMWDTLSGFIACFVEKEGESKYGEITGIGVLPNRRRKGVATALIRRASEYFIDADIDEIYCEVFEENIPSKMLIQAYGFQEVGKRAIPGMIAETEDIEQVPSGGKIMRRLGLRPRGD
jgi:ribosomal protein S18 acetylase RimI-like enzyme